MTDNIDGTHGIETKFNPERIDGPDLKSSSAHLGDITEWLKYALAKNMGRPIPDTAYFYCRMNDRLPEFGYCHLVLMDQRHAVDPPEAQRAGWIAVGPAINTSRKQIDAFASRFPDHFSDARFEFGNRNVVPNNYVAFGLSAPKELTQAADRWVEESAFSITSEWSTLFRDNCGIIPHLPAWDLNLADARVPGLVEKFTALSRTGLLFYPHVQLLPHANKRLIAP